MREIWQDWNDDIRDDLQPTSFRDLVVSSRDWTVETIINQIKQNNIDLNPKFQRRNAWTDDRRSLLIESLIAGVPVPEIVLAERPDEKRKFIVLDGKQRLLAIAGFVESEDFQSWNKPQLAHLKLLANLNGSTFQGLAKCKTLGDPVAELLNGAIRCTVLSNYDNDDVLYNIFYRLNTGSVPLSTQELRQVLCKGPFADYLIKVTNTKHPVQQYLGLSQPDPRLRDVEVLLRFFAVEMYSEHYRGNLKEFLDLTMRNCSREWDTLRLTIRKLNREFKATTTLANELLGEPRRVGRKYTGSNWERRFNKAIFEVEMFFFHKLIGLSLKKNKKASFAKAFESFCKKHPEFIRSIEVTTKSLEQYATRFKLFQDFINRHFGLHLKANEFVYPKP